MWQGEGWLQKSEGRAADSEVTCLLHRAICLTPVLFPRWSAVLQSKINQTSNKGISHASVSFLPCPWDTMCLPGSRASVSSPGKWGRRQNDSQLQKSVTLNLHPPCPHLSVSLCHPHPNLLVRIPGSIRPLATATRSLPITASGSHLENVLSVASAASMAPNKADRHPVSNTQRQSGPHTYQLQNTTCGT